MRDLFFRKKSRISYIGIALILMVLTVLSKPMLILGGNDCFLADVLQHFRLLYVFLAAIVAVLLAFFKKNKSALWAVLIVISNLFVVASHVNLFETESVSWEGMPPDIPTIQMMFLDMGSDLSPQNSAYNLAEIYNIEESDYNKKRWRDLIDYIKTGETDVFVFSGISGAFFEQLEKIDIYPYRHTNIHIKNSDETIILSKYPFKKMGYLQTSDYGDELWFSYDIGGRLFTMVASSSSVFIKSIDSWKQNKDHMAEMAEFAHDSELPVVVVGNFNSVPWSNLLAPLMERGGFYPKQGLMLTYPSSLPAFLRFPIDHVFAQKGVDVVDAKYHKNLGIDAEHLPMSVVLRPLFSPED
ncbi:MAG: hypothetical protein GY804_05530 [Alphaproteobacteria bacterium]|nr:hypothetical protein [Alphaproteobacteria bacterium]